MLISELIEELQKIQAEHGDIPAVTDDSEADAAGEYRSDDAFPVVAHMWRGHIILAHSPNYSKDLPKVVWL